MAAELEHELLHAAELVQSTGGVFEVEDQGVLIFSKKTLNRFPEEGEIISIIRALESGKTLAEAKQVAASNAPQAQSFVDWFRWKLTGKTNT